MSIPDTDLARRRRTNNGLSIAALLVLLGVSAAFVASCSGSKMPEGTGAPPETSAAPTPAPDPVAPPPTPEPQPMPPT